MDEDGEKETERKGMLERMRDNEEDGIVSSAVTKACVNSNTYTLYRD